MVTTEQLIDAIEAAARHIAGSRAGSPERAAAQLRKIADTARAERGLPSRVDDRAALDAFLAALPGQPTELRSAPPTASTPEAVRTGPSLKLGK